MCMKWLRRKLLNYVLRDLFLALTEDEILPFSEMPADQKQLLVGEAAMIKRTQLWQRLITKTKRKAEKRMFDEAQNAEDLYYGKAMLYVIDMIDKRIEALSKLNN